MPLTGDFYRPSAFYGAISFGCADMADYSANRHDEVTAFSPEHDDYLMRNDIVDATRMPRTRLAQWII